MQHRADSAHVQCSGKYFTYFESLLKIKLGMQDYESIMVQWFVFLIGMKEIRIYFLYEC